jgi:hypothetical protein
MTQYTSLESLITREQAIEAAGHALAVALYRLAHTPASSGPAAPHLPVGTAAGPGSDHVRSAA